MAEPRQNSDDEAKNRQTQYFIDNALHIPRLLESLQARSTDLNDFLVQLEEFTSCVPLTFANGADIHILKAVVDTFQNGIVSIMAGIILSDRWYPPSQDYATSGNLKILARSIRVLTGLLRLYSESEDDHAQAGFTGCGRLSPRVEDHIVNLFQKLWKHRHHILPIPAEDWTFWELKKEGTTTNEHERLESAVTQLVLTYGDAFALRFPTYKNTKYVLESGLLHLHCLYARVVGKCFTAVKSARRNIGKSGVIKKGANSEARNRFDCARM